MAENNQGGREREQNSQRRGFAGMDPERQREIASQGGKAAHRSGNANEFDSRSGAEAGRKGGQARSQNSQNNSVWNSEASEPEIM